MKSFLTKLLLLPMLFFSGFANGQLYQGKDLQVRTAKYGYALKGAMRNTFLNSQGDVIIREDEKSGIHLIRHNHEIFPEKMVDVKRYVKHNTTSMFHVFSLEDKICLMYSVKDIGTNTHDLYYQLLSEDELLVTQGETKIHSVQFTNPNLAGRYRLAKSPADILMIMHIPAIKGGDKKAGLNTYVKVFDSRLSLLWENEVSLSISDPIMDVTKIYVQNNGDIVAIGPVIGKSINVSKTIDNGDQVISRTLNVPGNQISSTHNLIHNNQLVFAGFTGFKKNTAYTSTGSYFLQLDAYLKTVDSTQSKFSPTFIKAELAKFEQRKIDKKIKKGKPYGIENLMIRYLIACDSNGFVLAGEQHRATEYKSNSRTTRDFLSEDIVLIGLNNHGHEVWKKKIPKYQFTRNEGGMLNGFFALYMNEEVHILYTESPKESPGVIRDTENEISAQSAKTHHFIHAAVAVDGAIWYESLGHAGSGRSPIYKRFIHDEKLGQTIIMLDGTKLGVIEYGDH